MDFSKGITDIDLMASASMKDTLRKLTLFRGTITVSIVYAIISVALLVSVRYAASGQGFAGESNFAFATTFIAGMLIIIGILVYKVATFKQENKSVKQYDDMICPDFWRLQKTDASVLKSFVPEQQVYMNYRCSKPDGVPGKSNEQIDLTSATTTSYEKQVADVSRIMYGDASKVTENGSVNPNKIAVDCTKMYPKYMSSQDIRMNPDTQNSMRCAYASKCGLAWSSVCQDN